MLGPREKSGKVDSHSRALTPNDEGSRPNSGNPYLNLSSVPSSGASSSILRKSSQTFFLDPTSRRIQLQIPVKQNFLNNNYANKAQPNHEDKRVGRVRIAATPQRSGDSSQTTLEQSSRQSMIVSKKPSETSTVNLENDISDLLNNDSDTAEDDNANPESMSRDIAKAVALIVAEYEFLQQQGKVDDSEPEEGRRNREKLERGKPIKKDIIKKNKDPVEHGTAPVLTAKPVRTLTPVPAPTVQQHHHQPQHDSIDKEVKAGGEDKKTAAPEEKKPTTPAAAPVPTTSNNNNNITSPANSLSRVEIKPEIIPSVGITAEEQVPVKLSSQLPVTELILATKVKEEESPRKVEPITPRASKKDSTVTIGLDFPTARRRTTGPIPRCSVPAPTPSKEARMGGHAEVKRYLFRVQHFINSLGYHREGEPDTSINVRLSMKTHMLTARDLINAAHPIKCLHAVVLCVHLTNPLDSVERFPIYFRSHVGPKEYKHIVLGIYCQGHYGAMGISRDVGLQDKKLIYTRLSDLIFEFDRCYRESGHILNEVKLGTIITHDQSSLEKLFNKVGAIPIHSYSKHEIETNVEKMAKQLRSRMGVACLRAVNYEKRVSPTPTMRRSRSKASLYAGARNGYGSNKGSVNVSNVTSSTHILPTVSRPRALSLGPNQGISSSFRLKIDDNDNMGLVPLSAKHSKTSTKARNKVAKPKRK